MVWDVGMRWCGVWKCEVMGCEKVRGCGVRYDQTGATYSIKLKLGLLSSTALEHHQAHKVLKPGTEGKKNNL